LLEKPIYTQRLEQMWRVLASKCEDTVSGFHRDYRCKHLIDGMSDRVASCKQLVDGLSDRVAYCKHLIDGMSDRLDRCKHHIDGMSDRISCCKHLTDGMMDRVVTLLAYEYYEFYQTARTPPPPRVHEMYRGPKSLISAL
jgi:DNA primase